MPTSSPCRSWTARSNWCCWASTATTSGNRSCARSPDPRSRRCTARSAPPSAPCSISHGAAIMKSVLESGGMTMALVIYHLTYAGIPPAYNLKITIDYQRVFDHLDLRVGAGVRAGNSTSSFVAKAGFHMLMEELKEKARDRGRGSRSDSRRKRAHPDQPGNDRRHHRQPDGVEVVQADASHHQLDDGSLGPGGRALRVRAGNAQRSGRRSHRSGHEWSGHEWSRHERARYERALLRRARDRSEHAGGERAGRSSDARAARTRPGRRTAPTT